MEALDLAKQNQTKNEGAKQVLRLSTAFTNMWFQRRLVNKTHVSQTEHLSYMG